MYRRHQKTLSSDLKNNTWIITESVSITNKPPTINKTSSCLIDTAIQPRAEPRDNDPVSPIKTAAGGVVPQNPKPLPIRAEENISISPLPLI